MRVTLRELQRMKERGEKIAMLTAYDHPSAVLSERAGVPLLLVGDSSGMVVQGRESTLSVTLDDMVRHASSVVRGTDRALVVADLPFLTYASDADAVGSARRLMQEAGVQAVKLEGGAAVAGSVSRLTALGVPVMGHLGFTPQSEHQLGVRVQAKGAAEARALLDDALLLERSGAFAVVLELVPAPLAAAVTRRLRIPTIGIGAGAGCDGQVQVWHDLLGIPGGDKLLRHTRRYAEIGADIESALRAYVDDVRTGVFPTESNSSGMDPDELARALDGLTA